MMYYASSCNRPFHNSNKLWHPSFRQEKPKHFSYICMMESQGARPVCSAQIVFYSNRCSSLVVGVNSYCRRRNADIVKTTTQYAVYLA